MSTLQIEAEITADGGLKLLSPLPAWLKPGKAKVLLKVDTAANAASKPKRQKLVATPEMLARREAALAEVRKLDPYRDITDPVAWQQEIRQDVVLPGRE